MSDEHAQKVRELRAWMQSVAGLNGRLDDDFLSMFLRSCDLDVESTKKTLIVYYENRLKRAEWFTNRDLNALDLRHFLHAKLMIALIDADLTQPVITLFKINRVGCDSRKLDAIVKYISVVYEVIGRRESCRLNGHVCLVDLSGYPWWTIVKCCNPSLCTSFVSSFLYSMPVCLKKVAFLNAPAILNAFLRIINPLLAQHHRNKIYVFGSDWSKLGEVVPLAALPVEYGGLNGTVEQHEEDFVREMMQFNDYLMYDDQFGFKSKRC